MTNQPRPIVVIGAGGLAREVEWLIHRINQNAETPIWRFLGFVVNDKNNLTQRDSTELIVGDDDWLLAQNDISVAIGIGTPEIRLRVAKTLEARIADEYFPCLIDPSVVYDVRSCHFEPGSIITAGCILTVNVFIDRFAYINLDCTIGHEANIGAGTVVNPSVNISGGVKLGKSVLVGTSAGILQNLQIADGAIVGAGGLVTRDVPANTTVVGVPARARVNST